MLRKKKSIIYVTIQRQSKVRLSLDTKICLDLKNFEVYTSLV